MCVQVQRFELLVFVVGVEGRAALAPVWLGARFELVDLGRELTLQAILVGVGLLRRLAFASAARGAVGVVLPFEEDVLLQF